MSYVKQINDHLIKDEEARNQIAELNERLDNFTPGTGEGGSGVIDVWEELCDITVEETARIDIDFEYPCREIYVYLSQENCETKVTGSLTVYPKMINDNIELGAYILNVNATNFDGFVHCINHGNMWIERFSGAINPQKNTTVVNVTGKVADRVFNQKIANKEDFNFYGFKSQATINEGARIRILGVKA